MIEKIYVNDYYFSEISSEFVLLYDGKSLRALWLKCTGMDGIQTSGEEIGP